MLAVGRDHFLEKHNKKLSAVIQAPSRGDHLRPSNQLDYVAGRDVV